MPLTDTAIRNAKIATKPYKLPKEQGLFVLINPNGSKLWRLAYSFGGREKLLSLGKYPEITLKGARERRDEARRLIANGIDPSQYRQQEKIRGAAAAANSFEAVAREWFTKHSPGWAPTHADKLIRRFENDVFPWVGSHPISEIEPPELLAVLRRIEGRGAIDTAHRAQQNCGQVFRYAIATGRATRNPAADLIGAIPPAQGKHYSTITDPKRIGELLRQIDDYEGTFVTRCALKLAPLLFVRPGELRRAEWSEVDLEAAEWRIPAHKMKARAVHVVPLSVQSVTVLGELQPLTGRGRFLFPGEYHRDRPMSENTVNAALRRLGFGKEDITGHGFRSMASTLLNEQGWNRDAIERQLAHAERDEVRAAYNHAEHLPERRKMMQAWADYLDTLRDGRKVVAGLFGKAA